MPDSEHNDADRPNRIEISRRTAMVAQRELKRTIQRTGGAETTAREANSALAEVKRRLSMAGPAEAKVTIERVEQLIDAVAEERNVDPTNTDPLVGATFDAERELRQALTGGCGASDAGPGAGDGPSWNGVVLTGDAYPGTEPVDGGGR